MKLQDELKTHTIFGYALQLEQTGHQKNTIFCYEDIIYIFNYDKTLLLRFKSAEKTTFKVPICFFANDYDSKEFEIEGNSIVFVTHLGSRERKKYCKIPNETFEKVDQIFKRFYTEEYIATTDFKKIELGLLNPSLSHIEFRSKDKQLIILQRDIYSGSLTKLSRQMVGMGLDQENIKEDFGPLGMRTNDFWALFAEDGNKEIVTLVQLNFLVSQRKYFIAEASNCNMVAIIAGCLYDDIGEIGNIYEKTVNEEVEKEDGRKIQENRYDEPEIDRQIKESSTCKRGPKI